MGFNPPTGFRPGPVFDAALETLRTGKVVYPKNGVPVPPPQPKFDAESDNIPMTIELWHSAAAKVRGEFSVVDTALAKLDTYLDSPFMADEQLSRNVYGDLVVGGVLLFSGFAALRNKSGLVAKVRSRFGQPLIATCGLASSIAPARTVSDPSPSAFPAHGVLCDGPPIGMMLLAVALVGRRSWVKMDTDGNNSRDTFHGLDSPLYSAVLRWVLGGKGDGKATVEKCLALLKSEFPGALPLGLATSDLEPVRAYCKDRSNRANAVALVRLMEQNPPRVGMVLRRYERAVLTAMPKAPAGSTAALGLDVRVEAPCQYVGKSYPAGLGILASPLSGGRVDAADAFTVTLMSQEIHLNGPDKPLDVVVPLPKECGALLWEIEWGGGRPAKIDGKPLDAAPATSPIPSPSPSPSGSGGGGIHKSAGIYGWRFGDPTPWVTG